MPKEKVIYILKKFTLSRYKLQATCIILHFVALILLSAQNSTLRTYIPAHFRTFLRSQTIRTSAWLLWSQSSWVEFSNRDLRTRLKVDECCFLCFCALLLLSSHQGRAPLRQNEKTSQKTMPPLIDVIIFKTSHYRQAAFRMWHLAFDNRHSVFCFYCCQQFFWHFYEENIG